MLNPTRELRRISDFTTDGCGISTPTNIDAILELPNGRWAAFEFKLGEAQADAAAKTLLHMASKVDREQHGEPAALVVVTGGRFAYRRPDGVLVVPITSLGP